MECRIVDICDQPDYFKFLAANTDRVTDLHADIVRMHTIHSDLIFLLRQASVQHARQIDVRCLLKNTNRSVRLAIVIVVFLLVAEEILVKCDGNILCFFVFCRGIAGNLRQINLLAFFHVLKQIRVRLILPLEMTILALVFRHAFIRRGHHTLIRNIHSRYESDRQHEKRKDNQILFPVSDQFLGNTLDQRISYSILLHNAPLTTRCLLPRSCVH